MPKGSADTKKYQKRSVIMDAIPEPIRGSAWKFRRRLGLIKRMVKAAANSVYYSGYLQTALREKPYDHKGRPFLWYAASMGDFLKTIDFRDKIILEFGAGHSTLWWSRHAKFVCAIEDNDDWYEYLAPLVQDNVELIHVTDDPDVAWNAVKGRKFDFIIVDCDGGVLDRNVCNEWSLDLIPEDGAILLDNSELEWFNQSAVPMFREKGFSRVDYYGIGATKTKPQCSSVFFKNKCFLWEGSHVPVRLDKFDDDVFSHTPYTKS